MLQRCAQWLYNGLLYATLPFHAAVLGCQVRRSMSPREYLKRRLTSPPISSGGSLLWVHAVSVGEVLTAIPLMRAWMERYPQWQTLLTTVTPTGYTVAQNHWKGPVAFLPLDLGPLVRRWIQTLRPALIVVMETEIWPNLFWHARNAGVPLCVVNGRISDRAYRRYRWIRPFIRWVLSCITCACVQTESHRLRFQRLGAPPSTLTVTGNLKFDTVVARLERTQTPSWLIEWQEGRDLVVFGSWTDAEWSILTSTVQVLVHRCPDVRILVAPRHIEYAPRWTDAWQAQGMAAQLRTQWQGERISIMVLDTMGELAACYAGAVVAVVGGSFHPRMTGHNPIEPGWFGVPVVMGPHHRDFQDVVEVFRHYGGIWIVEDYALTDTILTLLARADERVMMGRRARKAVEHGRGALKRTLARLEAAIRASTVAPRPHSRNHRHFG